MADLSIFSPPFIIERFCCIYGCHLANLLNTIAAENGNGGVMKHGRPENLRQHGVVVMPSGYGKSTFLRVCFHERDGIFVHPSIPTSVRATFSKEAWLGTHIKKDGDVQQTSGIFERYRRGIVAADEYARLAVLMAGDGVEHDEVYLLTALDTDTATKDLSTGSIELHGICTTIVAGLRVPRTPLQMNSGLSRRFTIEAFLPTPTEEQIIKKMGRKRKPSKQSIQHYRDRITAEVDVMKDFLTRKFPTEIDYWEINEWCEEHDIPHFEEDIYRRLAVGYAMVAGTFPHLNLNEELKYMFNNEIETREYLKTNPLAEAVRRVIRVDGKVMEIKGVRYHVFGLQELTRFMDRHYQLSPIEVRGAISAAKARGVRYSKVDGKESLLLEEVPI